MELHAPKTNISSLILEAGLPALKELQIGTPINKLQNPRVWIGGLVDEVQ
jgi:hypothetical protein